MLCVNSNEFVERINMYKKNMFSKILSGVIAVCMTISFFAFGSIFSLEKTYAQELSAKTKQEVIVPADVRNTDIIGGAAVSEYISDVAALTPIISAPRACIMDLQGNVLYGRALDDECKIASVTKIMTAIVAAEYNPDLILTVSKESANIPGSSAELYPNMKLTVKEALKGLMLPSGNDAAYAISAGVGEKMWLESHNNQPATEKEYNELFMQKMNEKAQQIGMTHSVFRNPSGLDDEGFEGDQHSTARDVAIMTAYANNIQIIADIVDDTENMMRVIKSDGVEATIKMVNTNSLLRDRKDVIGMKTGFTDLAGNCFAGTYKNDDDENIYVVVALGNDMQHGAMKDSAILMNWLNGSHRLFDMTANCDIDVKTGLRYIGRAGIPCWDGKRVGIVLERYMFSEQWYWNATPKYKVELNVPDGKVSEGDVIGTYKILDEQDNEIDSCSILAAETVEAPNFFESVNVLFNRVGAFFTGKKGIAEDIFENLEPMLINYDEVIQQVKDTQTQEHYMNTNQYGISNDDKIAIQKLLAENPDVKTNISEDGTIQKNN